MKAIVCELCGSNELLKEGELFVCQHCGTKYGPEEAKKLLVEVTGSVRVENPVQVHGMATADSLARRAKNLVAECSYIEAIDCCKRALEIDPDNKAAKSTLCAAENAKRNRELAGGCGVSAALGILMLLPVIFIMTSCS